ncbi:hypothetical protein MesoLjLc_75300 [Mesorhizobium sp. L-8-10]|uniref:glycoside hydrolase family 9 protein n=1 Tax=Mesorhizobium sp. L-8-10 TaxID=2744523 RepID=UPI001927FB6A|nr:glycoside hydrolase family 9 protein [Mesorhizobium sp. L-8-10]BCH35600.1 hypothetical protein MesoLjLc_75300 [Mesorhizobium sp. L-8-10]
MLARVTGWLLLLLLAVIPAAARADGVSVHDVAMAAPDIVLVELRDAPFVKGRIVSLDRPRTEAPGSWVRHGDGWGLVIGPKRDHLRLSDTPPEAFLDRAAIDNAASYAPIGGRKVVAVYRKSMPYDSGLFRGPGGDSWTGATMKHLVYLQLDRPLGPGTYEIGGPLPAGTRITFDERSIRAAAIHATQVGHRRSDVARIAFLSLWLPGGPDQGAVDFRRYGIDRFKVLDEAGEEVFAGAVRLRAGPSDPEPGNGLPQELPDVADAAAEPVPLVAVDGSSFTTRRPHGLGQGQRIALQRLRGEQDATATFATVERPSETGFDVVEVDGELPAGIAAGATVTPAHRANRAGTYVFELDYSDWKPARDGIYRLQIAGLGVSDPFLISEDVWLKSARMSIGGLYNHRSGIALDGRFGYERPAAFRPDAGMEIRESLLPLAWSSEFSGGFVPFEDGAKPAWLTERRAPANYWGGYMDAGDWDRRIQHVEVSALLLEVFESLPPEKRSIDLGVPKSSAVLGDEAYRDTDGLPDLVHEAIWVLDFFRRLQTSDGAIRGGIESAGHPLKGEPSYLEHQQVFAYAPDHLSSYKYAAAAAKLARVLQGLGNERLAALFSDSALAAWRAGERGFADPDAFYAEAVAAGSAAGAFAGGAWEERKAAMQAVATEYRAAAAAALFRLTGEAAYGTLFEERWRKGWDLYAHKGDAAWDYMNSPGANEAMAAEIRQAFLRDAAIVVSAQDRFTYPGMKHPAAPAGWGQGGAPDYNQMQLLMRAHRLSGDVAILRVMERAHHAMLGANQLGLSLISGAGLRPIGNPLHEDSLAMGIDAPDGITIYGWAPQAKTAHGWIFGPWWSPLPEVGTAEHAEQRRIAPPRFSLPYFEYLVEHPALVMQQEYTVQQSIGTMAALALYVGGQ